MKTVCQENDRLPFYNFIAIRSTFWSHGLEHEILEIWFSHHWSPNRRSPTLEGQVMFQWRRRSVLSACAQVDLVLGAAFPPSPLSHTWPASGSADLVACFRGMYLHVQTDEAKRSFGIVQILFWLTSLPSLVNWQATFFVCVGIYFLVPETHIWKWHILWSFPFSSNMLLKNP